MTCEHDVMTCPPCAVADESRRASLIAASGIENPRTDAEYAAEVQAEADRLDVETAEDARQAVEFQAGTA